ncbi:prephenate dehydrogenase [Halosimplex carlsbadense 2-9-1]|uniref:Prephenate dehydrogenase n=1 Tax=Halosimplex carlsbadense 2-9-1 TaxID=797114 RepID=M0CLY9_9EURY|nr:NAD(P)-binding domain-containing protein [Halosimplex carlsbadense]ELZ24290.1 prephenate dehydrogenase [Halosimplex carlsbadense 2-9-1]
MNLLVVGAGEMGRWFARTVAAGTPDPPAVAFTDTDPSAAREAATRLSAEGTDARAVPTDVDERFDVICFAVPIPAVESVVPTYADRADRALVDVSGVMGPALDAMEAAGPDLERVSLHPLFAAANAPGNVAVVAHAPGPVTDEVRAALADAGNDPFETTAREHDRSMETVQGRAHAAVLAFGLAAEPVADEFGTPVSEALFDVLETVTGNDPGVYADIQDAFDGAESVAEAARRIADADRDTFEGLYEKAGEPTTLGEER